MFVIKHEIRNTKFETLFVKFISFIFFTIIYYLLTTSVSAQENDFKTVRTKYEDNYTMQLSSGDVSVERVVTLTNATSKYYVTDYVISGGSKAVYDQLSVFEDGVKTDPIVENGTIRLRFNNPSVGAGAVKKITFSYVLKNFVKRAGESSELFIPVSKNAENEELDAYSISLTLPRGFSLPSLFKPYAKRINDGLYVWEDVRLFQGQNVYVLFSDRALYQVELHYALVNSSPLTKTFLIPFIPDGVFQKIYVTDISPPPIETQIDEDGNYLGAYTIAGQEAQKIVFKGVVELLIKPREDVRSYYRKQMQKFGLARYVTEEKYWQSTGTLKGGTVKDIYDFVVNTLSYNTNRINGNMERMGAIAVLKDPNNAVCMEYTDLFIALAREHNIASREVVGYAVTNDEELRPISFLGDILHAWPEYYDSAREYWRPIDPTWGDTSGVDYFSALDLNHISLVYHGKDTTYPLPPGVYKVNKNTKDVRVKPTYEIPRMESTYEITVPEKIVFNANTNNTLTFLLNAKMPVLGYNVLLELVDKNSQKVLSGMTLPVLEPYANKKLSFSIDTKMGILSKGNVLVRVNGTLVKEIPYEVTTQVVNILRKYGFIFVGLGIVLGILLLLKLYEHKSS